MDFLNKLGKKASETYQVTKEKTAKFSEEIKLKGKISDAKAQIKSLYVELGEGVYNQYKTNSEDNSEQIKEKCNEISVKFDEIAKLEADILSLKEVKKCIECGAELNKNDDFCSKCGKEQPKVEEEKVEVKEESEVQEVQEAEVTEVKDADETVENNESTENNE